MANFIKVKKVDGKIRRVNVQRILYYEPNEDGTEGSFIRITRDIHFQTPFSPARLDKLVEENPSQ